MNKTLSGKTIAFLVASGFNEDDLTHAQRALQSAGARIRLVSMDSGLVGAWKEQGWGLHFAGDIVLSSALAADFDALVIPGGERSVEKLQLTAHTKRFIGGFMDSQKPVAVFNDALNLLSFAERLNGLNCACTEAPITQDGCLLSGMISADNRAQFIDVLVQHMGRTLEVKQAA